MIWAQAYNFNVQVRLGSASRLGERERDHETFMRTFRCTWSLTVCTFFFCRDMYASLASLGRNDEVHREEFSRVIFWINEIFVIWGVWYGMLREPRVLSSCRLLQEHVSQFVPPRWHIDYICDDEIAQLPHIRM